MINHPFFFLICRFLVLENDLEREMYVRFLDLKIDLEREMWSTNPFIIFKKFFSRNIPPT